MHLSVFLKNNLLSSFVFLALLTSSALCLKCHECNSYNDSQKDCSTVGPQDTKYLIECGGSSLSCRTQEQWIDFEVLKQSPEKRVIRQCANAPFEPNRPCYYRTGFGAKTNVCNCLGDGCNSAARTASALLMTIGAFLLLKMFH